MGWSFSQSLLVQHQLRIKGILLHKNINRISVGRTVVDYMEKGWSVILIIAIVHEKGQICPKKV